MCVCVRMMLCEDDVCCISTLQQHVCLGLFVASLNMKVVFKCLQTAAYRLEFVFVSFVFFAECLS